MKTHALNPLRGAGAATEFARLPVEEHATVSNPNARAFASATATTRSLKLSVGRHTASFFTNKLLEPNRCPRWGARSRGVHPTGRVGLYPSGKGSSSA